jgi:hypothetical protein
VQRQDFDYAEIEIEGTLRNGSGERIRVRVQGQANSRAGYFAHKSFYGDISWRGSQACIS